MSTDQQGASTISVAMSQLVQNPYRILGLAADASRAETEQAAGSLQRALTLGRLPSTPWDLPWLGPVTRTVTGVKTALGTLMLPLQRLQARVWWYHHADIQGNSSSPASLYDLARLLSARHTATAHHDAALAFLLACVLHDPTLIKGTWWAMALTQWDRFTSTDAYWQHLLTVEQTSRFEPSLSQPDVDRVRSTSTLIVANILAGIASEALNQGDSGCATRILDLLQAGQATAHTLSPALGHRVLELEKQIRGDWEDRLHSACEHVVKGLKQVHYEPGFEKPNEEVCAKLTRQYEDEVAPFLGHAVEVLGPSTDPGRRARESAAKCLLELARAWTWADEFLKAEELLLKGQELGEDSTVLLQIEKVRNDIRTNVERQRARSSPAGPAPASPDILELLRQEGLELIDKRPAGGSLWVVGGRELAPRMRALREMGFEFAFAQNGSRSTRKRTAWYLRSD